jgi:hypothetical protein
VLRADGLVSRAIRFVSRELDDCPGAGRWCDGWDFDLVAMTSHRLYGTTRLA